MCVFSGITLDTANCVGFFFSILKNNEENDISFFSGFLFFSKLLLSVYHLGPSQSKIILLFRVFTYSE